MAMTATGQDALQPEEVARYFEITTGYKLRDFRKRPGDPTRAGRSIERPRKLLTAMLCKLTWMSLMEIAEFMGYAHHTSVIYARETGSDDPIVKKATLRRVKEVIGG